MKCHTLLGNTRQPAQCAPARSMTPRKKTDSSMAAQSGTRGSRHLVLLLCFLIVVIEGYDLIVYGAVLPTILKAPSWGLTPATAGRRVVAAACAVFVRHRIAPASEMQSPQVTEHDTPACSGLSTEGDRR
jgi:hypothetical protein